MRRFTLFSLVLPLSCFANAQKEKVNCPNAKPHYRATVRHIEGGGVGYKDGYTTLEAFLASDPSQWAVTPFLDAKGHIFNNGKWAANAGVGLRALWKDRAYGINTYYDYRDVGRFNSNQIGVGLETLGQLFDFRINGYLPVGKKISDPYDTTFKSFSGSNMLLSQRYKSAMKGADAEFGFHFARSRGFDFYTALGPYYFIGEAVQATWGGKARVLATFQNILTLEISDSFDRTFHNNFQGQIGLTYSFGPKSKVKDKGRSCKVASTLNNRMLQPVNRQEIIVIDSTKKQAIATDPATGLPFVFVFVDNTSSSNGTYESPYHTLTQAEDNSSPNDIIYVFPGDGTTKGMDTGIFLQANQKFWGSGTAHSIQTSQGTVSIPAQSRSNPTITNTNVDTEGNIVTLATNNAISGFTLKTALNDAIFGADAQSLDVSSCLFETTSTFPIQAIFSGDASVSITNNQFSNNTNGVFLTFNGTSTFVCTNNTFENQTSVSNVPIEITANNSSFSTQIENNLFTGNTTGSIRFDFTEVMSADISVRNNIITNNGTGSQSSLASSFVILSNDTTENCQIALTGNTFSDNGSNALYLHTSGDFTNLAVMASGNTITNSGGAIALATPTDNLTLLATDNVISNCNDNGIALIGSGTGSTGNITINNNTITQINNMSNGIAINQNFSSLNLAIENNEIIGCEGSGILSYAQIGIDSLTMNISGNTINDCLNQSSNAASGLDIEQFVNFTGSVTNNTFSGNTGTAVVIGSTLTAPTACLTLTGNNSSTGYTLTNPGDGVFHLSPCDATSSNVGTINKSPSIDSVQSCSNPTPCP